MNKLQEQYSIPVLWNTAKAYLTQQLALIARAINFLLDRSVDAGRSVHEFGAKGDGITDDTAAIQATINAAVANKNDTVHFSSGKDYKVTGQLTITQGVMIVAPGSQGSTQGYGCSITHYSNGTLFLWNGNGGAFRGTGGGLKNVLINKAAGFSGGDAIKLLATDDDHRPGEMIFDNVLVIGVSTGLWQRGLHIDGTACTTSGSKGVRSISLHKFRVADCTGNLQYIYVNQGVHIVGDYVQVDTGNGTGTVGMTVAGDSDNVMLSNSIINGELEINGSLAMNVCLTGRISTLDVNNTLVVGAAAISAAVVTNDAVNFRVLSNLGLDVGTGILNITAPGGVAAEGASVFSGSKQSGATTKVGYAGSGFAFSVGAGLTVTFTPTSAKLFVIWLGSGQAAVVFADFAASTISLVSNPSGTFVASSAPAATEIGIFKSASAHAVSVKNGTAGTVSVSICALGAFVSATTDPA